MALATSLSPATPLLQTNSLNPLAWNDDQILEKVYITHVHTAERYDVESLFNVTSNIIKRATAVADSVAVKVINLRLTNLYIHPSLPQICVFNHFRFVLQTGTPVGLIEDKVALSTFDPPFLKLKHIASQVNNYEASIHYYSFLLVYCLICHSHFACKIIHFDC